VMLLSLLLPVHEEPSSLLHATKCQTQDTARAVSLRSRPLPLQQTCTEDNVAGVAAYAAHTSSFGSCSFPAWWSMKACMISSLVFMTNGLQNQTKGTGVGQW
jgi:hypothetical protein